MSEIEQTDGQPGVDSTGTTITGTGGMGEQSVTNDQITSNGPGAEDTFFDPETIKDNPELMAAYRNMQSSYTKKTQSIASNKHKIDAYEAFERDPMGTIKQLAQQYGLQMVESAPDNKDWEPKTWDEVMKKAEDQAYQRLKKEMEPVVGKVQSLQKQSMESYMDSNYPDWRQYEDTMVEKLSKHPTFADDLDALYEISIPKEVREQRAYQKALKKVTTQSDASQLSGSSTTTKKPSNKPEGPLSFNQAVAFAKEQLQRA